MNTIHFEYIETQSLSISTIVIQFFKIFNQKLSIQFKLKKFFIFIIFYLLIIRSKLNLIFKFNFILVYLDL